VTRTRGSVRINSQQGGPRSPTPAGDGDRPVDERALAEGRARLALLELALEAVQRGQETLEDLEGLEALLYADSDQAKG